MPTALINTLQAPTHLLFKASPTVVLQYVQFTNEKNDA